MKHFAFYLILFFISTSVVAQNDLSDYAYIVVPQQFDFQSKKDQYHLNTLTRHLFNSNGFHAIYEIERGDLPQCNGLYADIDKVKAFLKTKVVIKISDCNGREIYVSSEGDSKEKDYKEAYQEAIREAFRSIAALKVNQQDIASIKDNTPNREPTETKQELVSKTGDEWRYELNGQQFLLVHEPNTKVLFEVSDDGRTQIAQLKPTSQQGIYLFVTNQDSTIASFDKDNNLLVDTMDSNGNAKQIVYQFIK